MRVPSPYLLVRYFFTSATRMTKRSLTVVGCAWPAVAGPAWGAPLRQRMSPDTRWIGAPAWLSVYDRRTAQVLSPSRTLARNLATDGVEEGRRREASVIREGGGEAPERERDVSHAERSCSSP